MLLSIFLLYTNNIYKKKINLYIYYNNNNNKTKFKKQNKLKKNKTLIHDTTLVQFNNFNWSTI